MSLIAIFLVSFFFFANLLIFGVLAFLIWRPHRAKVFISYSHKDAEIAERIIGGLQGFHFKIWVDLGKKIPRHQLEAELSRRINRRQIFVLIGSKNSFESDWVQFEIEKAAEWGKFLISRFRDTVVLALDEQGRQLFERSKEFYDELMLACWAKEKDVTSPEGMAKLADDLAELKRIGPSQPLGRRILMPMVTLIDFQQPFESAMEELSAYLRLNTLIGRLAPERKEIIKRIVFVYMLWHLLMVILTGVLLLALLLYRFGFS